MHRFLRRLALSGSLLALLATSAASVSAAAPRVVVGHVYVNNNSATTNGVVEAGHVRAS